MRLLSFVIAAGMAAFTAVSIAYAPSFVYQPVLSLGSHTISTFDLLFFAALAALVLRNALRISSERTPANRLVLRLCWTYLAYQMLVVLPAAVLLHGLRVIDVFRLQEVRLSLVLIPVTYNTILRYWKPSVLVALVDAAAAGLAIWVIINYATHGPQGYVESGVFRLRAVWGGGMLLFGWLFLTSLFYWPSRLWRLGLAALALAGLGLANERSGFLAFVASILAVLVTMRGIGKRVVIALTLLLVVSVGVLAADRTVRQSVEYSVTTMLNPSSDQTAQDRVIRSALGLSYFEHHPLGDYVWNRQFYSVNLGRAAFVPHNFVVQLLVTQGIIASLLYFAIIGCAFVIAWRNRRSTLSGLMLAYLVFYLTFCLLNANIDLPENISLFFICIALLLHDNRERQAVPDLVTLGATSSAGAVSARPPSTTLA